MLVTKSSDCILFKETLLKRTSFNYASPKEEDKLNFYDSPFQIIDHS